ncbi:divergent polysaccharide deacetylase family protein [Asticcacaulis sp. BYS171W]|uniref:Divergent polysaccharide deacetylase family protein n=1 Tax=Asticcacaulis aquaticus TaxID=2984212 RepID=A0ABT5HRI2_9CAUL|nr:divergent polysaccharide deacetylase family protein [Asticcacaulis aquaticus]MDC7682681.1 divergent polysaccharide deacetylase family protein [Asticcacaulis aquaticus]
MFAKQKLSALSSSSLFRQPTSLVARLKGLGPVALEALKKPYTAPLLAMGLFIGGGALFLNLASDPGAGSPSVRISMGGGDHAPKAATVTPTDQPVADDTTSGLQAFTLDSLGLFKDASADQFNASGEAGPVDGTAVITLPNDGAPIDVAASGPTKLPARPLTPAPIAGLSQNGPNGPLPIIATDGRVAAATYARPFKSNGKPMVALIVGGLGLNPTTTRAAIEQLPAEVTLSFVPYAEGLQGWIDAARAQGHEVLIEVPMEPTNYPDVDPGPQTLLINQRPDDMQARLNWVLGRAVGYFGVMNYQGSAFLRDKPAMNGFLGTMKTRGLSFIDDGQARDQGGAWNRASADRVIDAQINAQSITAQLSGVESAARSKGQALGTGFAYPVTLAVAIKWTQGLEAKGLQLAPASALAHK